MASLKETSFAFNGERYEAWSAEMYQYLVKKKLERHVAKNAESLALEAQRNKTPDTPDWYIDDMIAEQAIRSSMDPSIARQFTQYKTAASLWRALLLRYGMGDAYRARKLLILYDLRMREGLGIKADPSAKPGETREQSEWRRVRMIKNLYPSCWFTDKEGLSKVADLIRQIMSLTDRKEAKSQSTRKVTSSEQQVKRKREMDKSTSDELEEEHLNKMSRDNPSDEAETKRIAEVDVTTAGTPL